MSAPDFDFSGLRDGHVDDLVAADVSIREDPKLRPLQRLALLCDEGSLHTIRSEALSVAMADKARPGDGIVGAAGRVGGRPVFCYAQDSSFAAGSLGVAHAETIVRVQRLARRARVPLIGFVESGGARMQEGLRALDGYARVFAEHVTSSGEVPQISVITGTAAGGGAYSPALGDFVVMTDVASMFLTGPAVVREVTGEDVTMQTLGGSAVHARNGVSHFSVQNDVESILLVRELLGYLPQHAREAPPRTAAIESATEDPGRCVPLDPRRPYDVRDVVAGIVDAESTLEVYEHWATNLVTALARIEGRPVGIVANQPRHLGGVLDSEASQKGARFVRTCNDFGIPLVVLVDTPGFLPGAAQETDGIIRHGAGLLHAFASATVPRVTVVLRKAFGGAYITMNSRELGADLVLAWSRAQLGIMGAEHAVGVMHGRRLRTAADPAEARRGLAEEYAASHLTANAAARVGSVDEVIRPSETRARLAAALSSPAVSRT